MTIKSSYVRKKNLFDPKDKAPFKLSRSKLENFMQCPRCFYLDRRLGVPQPSIPAFTLNSAVDALLKKEFDSYRMQHKAHPLMIQHGIEAIPYTHPDLSRWQENFQGVQVHHPQTNFIITGAVDDVWQAPSGELFVVDYKSTSTRDPIDLNGPYKQAYKRQMEIYQWLLRHQGFAVSSIGYFLFANANKEKKSFEARLVFDLQIISYLGDDSWVEGVIDQARQCLVKDEIPDFSNDCEYCQYYQSIERLWQKPRVAFNQQKEFLF